MSIQESQATIVEPAPQFSASQAEAIAREHYGLGVQATELVSERDRNFRLRAGNDQQFVLKIANAAEPPVVTDFQIQALLHLEDRSTGIAVPRIRRTLAGDSQLELTARDKTHIARIVTYLDGVPLENFDPQPALARSLGSVSAQLGAALYGFEHPGSDQSLIWDMKRALELRELLHCVPDNGVRQLLGGVLDDFEQHAQPVLPGLRSQVIHNDLNPGNVLVDQHDSSLPVGVIDFGDMLKSPLIIDVAVCSSYFRMVDGDPAFLIGELVAGYHSITPLQLAEIDLLYDLIRARLAASICILHWRGKLRDDDEEYLVQSHHVVPQIERFLGLLSSMPRRSFSDRLRQVCASVDQRPTAEDRG